MIRVSFAAALWCFLRASTRQQKMSLTLFLLKLLWVCIPTDGLACGRRCEYHISNQLDFTKIFNYTFRGKLSSMRDIRMTSESLRMFALAKAGKIRILKARLPARPVTKFIGKISILGLGPNTQVPIKHWASTDWACVQWLCWHKRGKTWFLRNMKLRWPLSSAKWNNHNDQYSS